LLGESLEGSEQYKAGALELCIVVLKPCQKKPDLVDRFWRIWLETDFQSIHLERIERVTKDSPENDRSCRVSVHFSTHPDLSILLSSQIFSRTIDRTSTFIFDI